LFTAGQLPEGLQMIVSLEGDLTDAQKERLVEVSGILSYPALAAELKIEWSTCKVQKFWVVMIF
jgi:hypothetical protein